MTDVSITDPGGSATAHGAWTYLPDVKPNLHGLLARRGLQGVTTAIRPYLAGYVIASTVDGAVTWAQIEPTPGHFNFSVLQAAVTEVTAWNAQHPEALQRLKFRMLTGIHSPAWAMQQFGSVMVCDPIAQPTPAACPRFWTPQAFAHWSTVTIPAIAQYVNAQPLIAEAVLSLFTTVYGESFTRQVSGTCSDGSTVGHNLLAAGYTTALDQANRKAEIDLLVSAFSASRVGMAFSPYQVVESGTADVGYTQQIITYARSKGTRFVLENNSLRSTSQGPQYDQMYASMTAAGAPLGVQTAAPTHVGDLAATLAKAAQMGVNHVEIFMPPQALTLQQLQGAAAALPPPPA